LDNPVARRDHDRSPCDLVIGWRQEGRKHSGADPALRRMARA
jgi:hypothetical protein